MKLNFLMSPLVAILLMGIGGPVGATPPSCQQFFHSYWVLTPKDLSVDQLVTLKGFVTWDRKQSFSDSHGTHLVAREFTFLADRAEYLFQGESESFQSLLPENLRGLDRLSTILYDGKLYDLALVEPMAPESGVEQPQLRWWDHAEMAWLASRVPIPTGRGLGGKYRLSLYIPEGLDPHGDLAQGPSHSPAFVLISNGERVWGFPINDWMLPQ